MPETAQPADGEEVGGVVPVTSRHVALFSPWCPLDRETPAFRLLPDANVQHRTRPVAAPDQPCGLAFRRALHRCGVLGAP
jgi:hypothetical protein